MKLLDENGCISEELLSIVANTNDLMFVKNTDFVYIASSKAFAQDCIGCNSVDDVIGKTDYELFSDPRLAAHYREDDLRLLASGKDMLEFAEEYIDSKGIKHRCFTAKYLICTEDGAPVAIFGQYHDMDSQLRGELAERREQSQRASLALCRPFFVANYVDLSCHTYTNLWAVDYVRDMMQGCDTAEKGFSTFISLLVKSEYAESVREFCRLDTLPLRLKGKRQIDCEYLSKVAEGWCRVSFYPAEWDDSGEVSHVLFTVSPIDEKTARGIEEGLANKRDLSTLFDVVPSGIVVYKWDGERLRFLNTNERYRTLFGYDTLTEDDEPSYALIHPDDVPDYQNTIKKAVTEATQTEYVFRIRNEEKQNYSWLQINAVAKPQPNGTSLVYAIFTDITERKLAELRLNKSNASIMAALGASEQFSYEYDPVKHTATSFSTRDNGYHLGQVVSNFPERLRDGSFMHPDDAELFIETAHQIDQGADSARCTVRVQKDGKRRWHSCTFDAFFDSEKDYRVALLTVVDVTPQVAAKQNYEERIRSLLSAEDGILTMCTINLSQDTFEMVHAETPMQGFVGESASFEATMLGIAPNIVDGESRARYCRTFCRENLFREAKAGKMHLQQEYLLKMAENHYEWVTAAVDLVKNPLTEEIGGVAYCKSSLKVHMEHELLASALKRDYIFSAVVFRDTDEFYIYNAQEDSFGKRLEHFWDAAFSAEKPQCAQETIADMTEFYNKEKMCRYLEEHPEFSYAFDSRYLGEPRRLETKFCYLDKNQTTILVTLRDITDQRLQEQWRYDSEHDELTGLLNRKTVFAACRQMLTQYPDTRFVMVHCDVRHFHLYNTFFGEAAGDTLLCRIAEVIQSLEKDYCCYTCGRIESDVFCVFFPEENDTFEAHIRQCFRELTAFSPDFPLELAVGAYIVTDPSMSIESMFSRATIAAKSHSKNLFSMISRYDDAMDRRLRDTQQITSEMAAAIDQEQFVVYLQPKYSLRSEKVTGAEALVRWSHPERGMISPGVFIPVFEQNGFIAKLDRYMWEHVCQILRRWQDEGRPLYPVSVNISRVSMYNRATVSFLKSLVEKYRLEPRYLELELTETAYMDDPEELTQMLQELQDYGFRILMDDFGSGYSSLNTLRALPVDVLKLDMKFLADSQNDSRANVVLSSVVRMSKMLRLPIVAEGVEMRAQADYLCRIGCEYAQGYLFARPMPVPEYEQLLAESGIGLAEAAKQSASEPEISTPAEEIHYSANASEMVRAIDNTGIRMFMYFPQDKTITVPGKTCAAYGCAPVYSNMPHSFADDYVHPDDYPAFKEMYYKIDRGEGIADATFHSKDYRFCNHVTLTTVSWSPDGKPKDVFGLIENRSDQFHNEQFIKKLQEELAVSASTAEMDDVLKNIAMAISNQYCAIYYIWLDSQSYVCLQESATDHLEIFGEKGAYKAACEGYIHMHIEESEQDKIRQFMEISSIESRLGNRNALSHVYRQKEIGWTKGQFLPAKRDENGRLLTVIYTVSDINAEVENSQKRTEAEQEALHDPMTGLWNRKAFDHFRHTDTYTRHPTGLMLFDIDRFKGVNDQFGHETGDLVIKSVADQVRNVMRRNDLVFRMGGDEFAVLLYECKESLWNSLCRKISQVHADVQASVPQGLHPTISVGLCLNPDGYRSEMYQLADRALYQTKINGRGGCTMIDLQGNILREWHDSSTVLRKGDILERNSTVTWRVEIPKKEGLPVRAYGDDLFTAFIGASQNQTPEKAYQMWLARLQPDYLDIVRASVKAAIAEGSSEAVYQWNHPEKGVVQLRSSVSFDSETDSYYSLIGYAHITSGMHIFTLGDVGDRVRTALDELYFCNFYIRLSDKSFRVYKAQPYMTEMLAGCSNAVEAIASYVKYMVAEESKEEIASFMDLETLPQRLEKTNLISTTYLDPNIGWSRAVFVAVDRGADGLPQTVSLVVETI